MTGLCLNLYHESSDIVGRLCLHPALYSVYFVPPAPTSAKLLFEDDFLLLYAARFLVWLHQKSFKEKRGVGIGAPLFTSKKLSSSTQNQFLFVTYVFFPF